MDHDVSIHQTFVMYPHSQKIYARVGKTFICPVSVGRACVSCRLRGFDFREQGRHINTVLFQESEMARLSARVAMQQKPATPVHELLQRQLLGRKCLRNASRVRFHARQDAAEAIKCRWQLAHTANFRLLLVRACPVVDRPDRLAGDWQELMDDLSQLGLTCRQVMNLANRQSAICVADHPHASGPEQLFGSQGIDGLLRRHLHTIQPAGAQHARKHSGESAMHKRAAAACRAGSPLQHREVEHSHCRARCIWWQQCAHDAVLHKDQVGPSMWCSASEDVGHRLRSGADEDRRGRG